MNQKQVVLEIRTAKKLRGKYPCVIEIEPNGGKILLDKKLRFFVMTITNDNMLYFHGLTKWLKKYDEEEDFMIKLSAIKAYTRQEKNKYTSQITISTEQGFYVPITLRHGIKGTYESANNMEYILKELEKMGIKKDII